MKLFRYIFTFVLLLTALCAFAEPYCIEFLDNDDHILNFLRIALTKFGYKVIVAHDGVEGIETYNNGFNFDLVITDINMPEMNGNEVAKYIRASHKPDIPILAATDSPYCIEKECFNFVLIKPFKLENLLDILRFCITRN